MNNPNARQIVKPADAPAGPVAGIVADPQNDKMTGRFESTRCAKGRTGGAFRT
jgi:hypothetical protein